MSYCLVTGGAGFIGSHIVDELIEMRKKVIVLDDLSGGFKKNVNPEALFIKGSITNKSLINNIFKQYKIDYIYHLAAYAAENLSHFIKYFNYNNNLMGSINLINNAVNNKVKCFIFTSSIAVYGHQQPPFTENVKPEPADSYGIAKLAVEQEIKITKEMFGLDYVIFRPHNVYGERQNIGDKYRNVAGIFLNQVLRKEPLTIFGDGKQKRAFTYIKDISGIIAKSGFNKKCYGEIFNVGSDTVLTVNHIAKSVCKYFGIKPNIKYCEARKEAKFAFSIHKKIKKYFKGIKETPFEVGLEKMVEWVKKEGSRESKKFKNIEIIKNLPRTWAE